MKKWVVFIIVFVLLVSVVTNVSADPGNGTNAYTMPAKCGGGEITVQILNDSSQASFRVGIKGSVGILKAIYIMIGPNWIPIYSVPGTGVYERTTTCVWEEGGYTFKSEVLIPHD
ncbi:MAG: hypothetical protein C3F13_15925 [Anaerolineales bacterium]|nr:MAG: hypothetical protein C3F13_15925 [Anaerolineales bacterium]